MADEKTLEVNEAETGETPEPEIDYKALYESEKANAEKWKAMSRKNEDAYKKAAAKNEADPRIQELEKRAEKAEQEADVLRKQKELADLMASVAEKYEFQPDVVSLIRGDDEEELTANVAKLRSLIPTAPVIKDSGNPIGQMLKSTEKNEFVRSLFNGE